MSDSHVKDQLSSYLDDMLKPVEKAEVYKHLADCPECRQHLIELKSMVNWMKTVPKPSPALGLETRWLANLRDWNSKKHFKFPWVPVSGGLATVMATILVIVMVQKSPLDKKEAEEEVSNFDLNRKSKSELAAPPMDSKRQIAKAWKSKKKIRRSRAPNKAFDDGARIQAGASGIKKNQKILLDQDKMSARDETRLDGNAVGSSENHSEELIIKSKAEWKALANRLGPDVSESLFSSLDFSKNMVVGIRSLRIIGEEFREGPEGRTLYIKVRTAPSSKKQPPHFKSIPLFNGPIRFQTVK